MKTLFICFALMVLAAFTGCRDDKDSSRTSDSPNDRIVAELSELSVDDLISFHTNVSTMVASTNLGVAVARELKRRYNWIKVYEQPWEFDGCRHTLCHSDHLPFYMTSFITNSVIGGILNVNPVSGLNGLVTLLA